MKCTKVRYKGIRPIECFNEAQFIETGCTWCNSAAMYRCRACMFVDYKVRKWVPKLTEKTEENAKG